MPIKTSLIIIVALFCASAQALEPHFAKYQLSIDGLKIAEEIRTLHKLEDNFFYTANAKTTGIAALVKKYSAAASSSFTIDELGVDDISYQIMELEDAQVKENYSININSKHLKVISNLTKTQPTALTWDAKPGSIVDPLSLFLALAHDLEKTPDKTEFFYQVANGKSVKQHHYKKTGNQSISLNQKTIKAIKIEKIGDVDKLEAYFLPEYQYLPISIKQVKNGRNYHYQITNYQLSAL